MTDIKLSYEGRLADNHVLDMYDAARALSGFQRSLALTAHLVINGEIITQAPSLKNAQILTKTPSAGSWEVVATIVGAAWVAGTAGKESPLGHLLYSIYDYVVSSTLGFHVDYKKSLSEQYGEYLEKKKITAEKIDSLIEKTETSLTDMHRPIVGSATATGGKIIGYIGRETPKMIGQEFSSLTYEYISHTVKSANEYEHHGRVSSYNLNTFKGRIFLIDEDRPIPFELSEQARDGNSVALITSSLRANAVTRLSLNPNIVVKGFRLESSTGRLKALIVSQVRPPTS